MDGGAWEAAVHGVAKSWTQLSDFIPYEKGLQERALRDWMHLPFPFFIETGQKLLNYKRWTD